MTCPSPVVKTDEFQSVGLADLERVSLLNRIDTKYVFNSALLPETLDEIRDGYNILEIGTNRLFPYKTFYFDTSEFALYFQHHNGKANRCKIRSRQYVLSGTVFDEIKQKSNTGHTNKTRLKRDILNNTVDSVFQSFIDQKCPTLSDSLRFSLEVNFERMTLVDRHLTERVTIDTGLRFSYHNRQRVFPSLAIIEIKREKHTADSSVERLLRKKGLRRTRCSKYCLGILSIHTAVKANNFKPMLRAIEKNVSMAPCTTL